MPYDGATEELDFGEPAQGTLGCIQAEQFWPLDDVARFFDPPSSSVLAVPLSVRPRNHRTSHFSSSTICEGSSYQGYFGFDSEHLLTQRNSSLMVEIQA